MGFSPRDVDQMTIWEFSVVADAHAQARGKKRKGKALDEQRLAEMGIEGF